jgi:Uma2 family endonuclease
MDLVETRPPRVAAGTIALVVEYLSPEDRFTPTIMRVVDFLNNGVSCVCLVDPETRALLVFPRGRQFVVVEKGEEAEFAVVLPEFRCPLADFFDDEQSQPLCEAIHHLNDKGISE